VVIASTKESGDARARAQTKSYAFPQYGSIGTYTFNVTTGIV
jgi:hypothetical protein